MQNNHENNIAPNSAEVTPSKGVEIATDAREKLKLIDPELQPTDWSKITDEEIDDMFSEWRTYR